MRSEAMALEHLEQGRTLLDSNDVNGAIAELSQAASANPEVKRSQHAPGRGILAQRTP